MPGSSRIKLEASPGKNGGEAYVMISGLTPQQKQQVVRWLVVSTLPQHTPVGATTGVHDDGGDRAKVTFAQFTNADAMVAFVSTFLMSSGISEIR